MVKPTPVEEQQLITAIERLVGKRSKSRAVTVGLGDDAAVVSGLKRVVLTSDSLVENVHFKSSWISPRDLGRRSFRVAASDVYAMGAEARFALLSLVFPKDYSLSNATAVARGFVEESANEKVTLVGGNISRGQALEVHVTVVGEGVQEPLLRSKARAGQAIYVTGSLGDAAAGRILLDRGTSRGPLVKAFRLPETRAALACDLAGSGPARAMMDVSDGLVKDLERMAEASGTSMVIDIDLLPVSVPLKRWAKTDESQERRRFFGFRSSSSPREDWAARAIDLCLHGGEDYQLLFSADADQRTEGRLARIAKKHGTAITRIGRVAAKPKGSVVDADGNALTPQGFEHFDSKR